MRGAKRGSLNEGRQRQVRRKDDSTEGETEWKMMIITNMEPIRLDPAWFTEMQAEFRMADMFGFLRFSQNLPDINADLLEEFVRNYDLIEGISTVQGREILIDERSLHMALYLPVSEIAVIGEESSDLEAAKYFKSGEEAFEKTQGWKTMDAMEPKMGEWMRLAVKRLALHRHSTYLPKRLLYPVVATASGMVFNWAAYVSTRIHGELSMKIRLKKMTSLLCSNYIFAVITYQLSQPLSAKEQSVSTPPNPISTEEAVVTEPVVITEKDKELEAPVPNHEWNRDKDPSSSNPQVIPFKSFLIPGGMTDIKRQIISQIVQLHETAMRLEGGIDLRRELDQSQRTVAELTSSSREINSQLESCKAECSVLRREGKEKEENWNRLSSELRRQKELELKRNEELRTTREQDVRTIRAQGQQIQELTTQRRALTTENAELKKEITELKEKMAQLEINPVSVSSEGNVLKLQVEDQDRRIKTLETQIRELGAYNDELLAQLSIDEGMDEDNEEAQPEPNSVEETELVSSAVPVTESQNPELEDRPQPKEVGEDAAQ